MAMSSLEKIFVNREGKGRRNATKVQERLIDLDTTSIHDVLEIGCGIGTVSAILSETYQFNLIGTDFDPAQIRTAQKLYPENDTLQFQVEDAANLTFSNGSMDLVVAYNVFHHIPDWHEAFGEVYRVLRPGGYLIWLDIIFISPLRNILRALENKEAFFSLDEIVQESLDRGFLENYHDIMPLVLFSQHHFVFQKP